LSKTCLIAGCSHTAGSEIDGDTDSPFNRQHSYGNLLAQKLGYTPVNIAVSGYTNSAIARSVLEYCSEHDTSDLFVVIGWSESSRIEAPFAYPTWHQEKNGKYCDWFSNSSTDFLQINVNYTGYSDRERDIQEDYRRFVVNRTEYMEITSANLILQLQYFFKSKNIDYVMCNTAHMFSPENHKHLKFYFDSFDKTNYYNFDDNKQSFYPKYIDLGYTNLKAQYGHHSALPHELYADELYNFIKEKHDTAN